MSDDMKHIILANSCIVYRCVWWPWLTYKRDAFIGQSRSPNIAPFHMLGVVSYCNFVFNTRRFYDVRLQKMSWPWNRGQRSLKVFESGTIR